MPTDEQQKAAGEAFSKQSIIFDAIEEHNAIIKWMRKQVRNHVVAIIKPKSQILELNAGTGLDAIFFASKGHKVHFTDIAEGMIAVMKTKIQNAHLEGQIFAEKKSYTDLHDLPSGFYDHIFSNFGGLNCIPDLKPVIEEFKRLLKPGGKVTLVIMPKISPWELLTIFKGNKKMALRRFKKDGTPSNVEGVNFKSWYFNAGDLIKDFGKDFRLVKWQGLGSIVPPPYKQNFPVRFPAMFRLMTNIEERISGLPVFRSWADHYILSMEYLAPKEALASK